MHVKARRKTRIGDGGGLRGKGRHREIKIHLQALGIVQSRVTERCVMPREVSL